MYSNPAKESTKRVLSTEELRAFRPEVGKMARGHYKNEDKGKLYTIDGTITAMTDATHVTIDNGKRVRVCCHVQASPYSKMASKYKTFLLPEGKVARVDASGVSLYNQVKEVGEETDEDYGTPMFTIPSSVVADIAKHLSGVSANNVMGRSGIDR
jgi:hypothetical protein